MTSSNGTAVNSHPTPALGPVLDFMRLIWAIDHALQRTSKRMASTLGVTGPQRLVIRIVGRFPGIAAGRLAEILHIHPSTLTGVLKRLERQELIRRRPDPRDGRRSLLGLTGKGRQLNVEVEGTIESVVQHALTDISPSKLVAAQEVLGRLARALQESSAVADGTR